MPNEVKSGAPPREAPRTLASAAAPFNVDAVEDIAGYATVNGRRVTVHQLDGAAYRALRRLEEAGTTDATIFYDAVRRCVPELSSDEVDRLRPKQIGTLLAIAGAMIDLVEAEQRQLSDQRKAEDPDPNGSRPTSSESPASA